MQLIRYLFVIDLEANCLRDMVLHPQEIIQIACEVVDTKTRKVVDKFNHYITPDVPVTKFCTELTGITQETTKTLGASFMETMEKFMHFMKSIGVFDEEPCAFYCDGACDVDLFLKGDLERRKMHIGCSPFNGYFNARLLTASATRTTPRNFLHMLKLFDIEFEGKQHNAIDDCRNLTRLCIKMLEEGWVPQGQNNCEQTKIFARRFIK